MSSTTMPAPVTTLWERMIEDMNLHRMYRSSHPAKAADDMMQKEKQEHLASKRALFQHRIMPSLNVGMFGNARKLKPFSVAC